MNISNDSLYRYIGEVMEEAKTIQVNEEYEIRQHLMKSHPEGQKLFGPKA